MSQGREFTGLLDRNNEDLLLRLAEAVESVEPKRSATGSCVWCGHHFECTSDCPGAMARAVREGAEGAS